MVISGRSSVVISGHQHAPRGTRLACAAHASSAPGASHQPLRPVATPADVGAPDEESNQTQSVAVISGHQRSSEAIRGEAIRGHQRSSVAIRGHQRSSEVISTHLVHVGDGVPPFEDHNQRSSEVIRGHQHAPRERRRLCPALRGLQSTCRGHLKVPNSGWPTRSVDEMRPAGRHSACN